MAHPQIIDADPIAFALKGRTSLVAEAIVVLLVFAA
jgi:hypothetical protein